ncbi:MAG: CBS domain-containing protein [Pirellulales bacterium]
MKLQVKEIMTSSVVTVKNTDDVDVVVSLMIRHNISGIPVVDDNNILRGVISERDLLCLLTLTDDDKTKVMDYATFNVVMVYEDTPLVEVVEMMTTHAYRRLPVIDHDGKLLGVISRRDMIRFIRDLRVRLTNVLETRKAEMHAESTASSVGCT